MIKYTSFDPYLEDGTPTVWKVPDYHNFTKEAHLYKHAVPAMPQEISSFIDALQHKEGSLYFLNNAMGCEELWGANRNGDTFPSDQLGHPGLEYGYRTFTTVARPFRGHNNKDPQKGYGDIPFAHYDRATGRVYLVLRIDTNLPHYHEIADVIQAYDRGDPVATSMGARVPYDICSICGNKAPTRAQYCIHARDQLGTIYSDGRRVSVRNVRPVFFDNSFVTRGADPAAFLLQKLAQVKGVVPGVDLAPVVYGNDVDTNEEKLSEVREEVAEQVKVASIQSPEVQTMADPIADPMEDPEELHQDLVQMYNHFAIRQVPFMEAHEAEMPKDLLNKLGQAPIGDVLASFHMLGISPRPKEFQRIVLAKCGHEDLADMLDAEGITFEDVPLSMRKEAIEDPYKDPDQAITSAFVPIMCKLATFPIGEQSLLDARSGHRPFILKRAYMLSQSARQANKAMPMNFAGVGPGGVSQMPAFGGIYQAGAQPLHQSPAIAAQTEPKTLTEKMKNSALPAIAAVGGLYLGAKMMKDHGPAIFKKFEKDLSKHKDFLIPMLVLGALATPLSKKLFAPAPHGGMGLFFQPKEASIHKEAIGSAATRLGVGIPAAYLAAGHQRMQTQYGKKPGVVGRTIRDNPGKMALGFGLFGGVLPSLIKRRGRIKKKAHINSQMRLSEASEKLGFLLTNQRFAEVPEVDVDQDIVEAIDAVMSCYGA